MHRLCGGEASAQCQRRARRFAKQSHEGLCLQMFLDARNIAGSVVILGLGMKGATSARVNASFRCWCS